MVKNVKSNCSHKKLMNSVNRDIAKLVKGCVKQEREAQKALYKQFYSYSMSICLRYAKSREDATEIMNDGFFNVFRYIRSFDLQKPFRHWLRKIMINSAIDHIKKNNKIQSMENLDTTAKVMVEETELDTVSYEDLIEMIRKLPPSYGAVFNLRAIEGYTHEEVAGILGITVGTSKSNYAKAKAKLQEYLAIYFGVKQ